MILYDGNQDVTLSLPNSHIRGSYCTCVSRRSHLVPSRHATASPHIHVTNSPCMKANRSYLILRVYPARAVCTVLQTVLEQYPVIVACRPRVIHAFRTPASYYAGPSLVPGCDVLSCVMKGQFGCE
jgi:hypothetical protein